MYQLADFDALEMSPAAAVNGLRDSTNRTADTLTGLLR